jgi:hypothetical protein
MFSKLASLSTDSMQINIMLSLFQNGRCFRERLRDSILILSIFKNFRMDRRWKADPCCPLSKAYLTRALPWLPVQRWRRNCQISLPIKLVSRSICARRFKYLAGKCYVASADWSKNIENKYLFSLFLERIKK